MCARITTPGSKAISSFGTCGVDASQSSKASNAATTSAGSPSIGRHRGQASIGSRCRRSRNGARYASISSGSSRRCMPTGKTNSRNWFSSRMHRSPTPGVRKASKYGRAAGGQSSQVNGLISASMRQTAAVRSVFRLAQSSPRAPPQSWPTRVTRSNARASNQAAR